MSDTPKTIEITEDEILGEAKAFLRSVHGGKPLSLEIEDLERYYRDLGMMAEFIAIMFGRGGER
jgi:hypothetical protein